MKDIRDIARVARAVEATKEVKAWWDDKNITDTIEFGVSKGWLVRLSHTQVEWTEAGAKECKRSAK